jgi:hypothetical protein
LVRTVHSKGRIGVLGLIDIAAHGLGTIDIETDDIVPGGIVQIVDTLLQLGIVLVELGRSEAILGRTIQEFVAGGGAEGYHGSEGDVFQSFFHNLILHLLESDVYTEGTGHRGRITTVVHTEGETSGILGGSTHFRIEARILGESEKVLDIAI